MPGVIKEDQIVGLPFKSKKPKRRATIIAEDVNASHDIIINSTPTQSNNSIASDLQMRIGNRWSNFNNTISLSDINDINDMGYMYFGDILVISTDYEEEFAHVTVNGFDGYRIGTQEEFVYQEMGLDPDCFQSISSSDLGTLIQDNYMYDFADVMTNNYDLETLLEAGDSFRYDDYLIINLRK